MASGDRDSEDRKMQQILESVGLGEAVIAKFRDENITPSVVKDLDKGDFEMLGVTRLGDQKRLRLLCNPSPMQQPSSTTVIDEVRRIMGYATPRLSRPGPSQSGFNPQTLINRRSRRRQSGSTATPAKSGKGRVIRNLSVIKHDTSMEGVKEFRPRDITIIVRGLVEFPPNASEEVIRNSIALLIQNSEMDGLDAKEYGPNDFEFVKRTGHSLVIPEFAPDFELDLSALKTLIGQGDVYVRLTVSHTHQQSQNMNTSSWSDDSDFEQSPNDASSSTSTSRCPRPTSQQLLDDASAESSFSASSQSSRMSSECTHRSTSYSSSTNTPSASLSVRSSNSPHFNGPRENAFRSSRLYREASHDQGCSSSSLCDDSRSQLRLTSLPLGQESSDLGEPIVISSQEETDDDGIYVLESPPQGHSPKRGRYSEGEITVRDLYSMFSNLPKSTIDCVIDVAENTRKVFNILLNGVKSFPVLAELSKRLSGTCNTISVSQDSILSDAVAYYKKPSLDMTSPLIVKYRDMPAMDAGGPSRQFFL